MSPRDADAVWHAAQPLIVAALDGIPTSVLDDLNMMYTNESLYVTAKFPQNLSFARDRLRPAFERAGWSFREESARPRLMFTPPRSSRANLRVVQ